MCLNPVLGCFYLKLILFHILHVYIYIMLLNVNVILSYWGWTWTSVQWVRWEFHMLRPSWTALGKRVESVNSTERNLAKRWHKWVLQNRWIISTFSLRNRTVWASKKKKKRKIIFSWRIKLHDSTYASASDVTLNWCISIHRWITLSLKSEWFWRIARW